MGFWKSGSARESVRAGLAIADLFSRLDTGSKATMSSDFASKLADARSMVQKFCGQYHMPTSNVGLAGGTAALMKYMHFWMGKM